VGIVELRTYSEQDRQLTLALESDPEVVRHLGGVVDADGAAHVHERRMAAVAGGDLFCTIIPDGASEPVGVVAIWRAEWESRPIHELGGMLVPEYHARGIMARAVTMLLPRAVHAGVRELHSFPGVTNRPSNAVLERLGFQRLEDCDLDYEGRPIRCAHWLRDLSGLA
jgi:RimJ/RimL family protein N-acetyltransferase